jgi:hypothetical protein
MIESVVILALLSIGEAACWVGLPALLRRFFELR